MFPREGWGGEREGGGDGERTCIARLAETEPGAERGSGPLQSDCFGRSAQILVCGGGGGVRAGNAAHRNRRASPGFHCEPPWRPLARLLAPPGGDGLSARSLRLAGTKRKQRPRPLQDDGRERSSRWRDLLTSGLYVLTGHPRFEFSKLQTGQPNWSTTEVYKSRV